jgi:hypothetical protein
MSGVQIQFPNKQQNKKTKNKKHKYNIDEYNEMHPNDIARLAKKKPEHILGNYNNSEVFNQK